MRTSFLVCQIGKVLKRHAQLGTLTTQQLEFLVNYETVDTYYRRSSSSIFVGSVMVPLLCISSLDDLICTSEAIPWDECRLNSNVVLATTRHGGHLPFFEGPSCKKWVRVVEEFFCALECSPLRHRRKQLQQPPPVNPLSSIDHSPYVRVVEDGVVTAVSEEIIVGETEVVHQNDGGDGKKRVVKKGLNMNSLWVVSLAYIVVMVTWPGMGSSLSVMEKISESLVQVQGYEAVMMQKDLEE